MRKNHIPHKYFQDQQIQEWILKRKDLSFVEDVCSSVAIVICDFHFYLFIPQKYLNLHSSQIEHKAAKFEDK